MEKIKNQNGYGLVLVLLAVVLLSVIGLGLFTITTGNAKQISVVNRDMQAVDIAEMGATQYKNALSDTIEKTLSSRIQIELSEKEHDGVITAHEIIESIIARNHGKYPVNDFIIQDLIGKQMSAWNASGYTQKYEIQSEPGDIIVEEDENGKYVAKISYKSIGTNGEKISTVEGELNLPLEVIIQDGLSTKVTQVNKNNPDFQDLIELLGGEPTLTSPTNCSNNSPTLTSNSSCINYTGKINKTSNNSTINNVNAIIKNSDLELGNKTEVKNSTLIINGTIKGGNNSLFTNSFITVLPGDGDVQFMNGVSFNDTVFHSYKKFTANNISSNSSSNSKLVFHNGAQLKQINDDFKKVTMYVNKDLSINAITGNKKIDNSTFYITSNFNLNGLQGKIQNTMIYIVDDFVGQNISTNNISNSTICVGGNVKLNGNIVKNPSAPFKKIDVDYHSNDTSENKIQKLVQACSGQESKETTSFQDDLLSNLIKEINDNTNYNYH